MIHRSQTLPLSDYGTDTDSLRFIWWSIEGPQSHKPSVAPWNESKRTGRRIESKYTNASEFGEIDDIMSTEHNAMEQHETLGTCLRLPVEEKRVSRGINTKWSNVNLNIERRKEACWWKMPRILITSIARRNMMNFQIIWTIISARYHKSREDEITKSKRPRRCGDEQCSANTLVSCLSGVLRKPIFGAILHNFGWAASLDFMYYKN